MPDSVPHFSIRNMISVGDAEKSPKASQFCFKDPCFTNVLEDSNGKGTEQIDFGAESNVLGLPFGLELSQCTDCLGNPEQFSQRPVFYVG